MVASVIGVAVGVVFWAWGVAWGPVSAPVQALLPGLQAAPAAVWLIAGVLGGLVIRKTGAAVYTELVPAFERLLAESGSLEAFYRRVKDLARDPAAREAYFTTAGYRRSS